MIWDDMGKLQSFTNLFFALIWVNYITNDMGK